jgi:hypothetical protein
MTSKRNAGRVHSQFNLNHFSIHDKVQNNSNRYFWECNYCSKVVEGRDNKLPNHIDSTEHCPDAPAEARHAAKVVLLSKAKMPEGAKILTIASEPSTSSEASGSSHAVTAVKKRKGPGLEKYMDHGLTPALQAEADIRLFRSVHFIY